MINIYLFIITFIVINIYLVYNNNINNIKDISSLITNEELLLIIDFIIVIYILYQYYIYYTISHNKIKELAKFTTVIDKNSLRIDLSNNKDIKKTSTKIIYWIVSNNNGTYNNYSMNGIANIVNNQVIISIKDIDIYSNLELKYYVVNQTDLGESISDISSIIIK
jgi:hypothetical protein